MCVVRLFIKISTVVAFSKKVTMQICNYQRIQSKKLQYRKFGITGLKTSLRATEKYAYCLGYLQFMAFQSWNAIYVPFLHKKRLKRKFRQKFLKCSRTWPKRGTEVLQFDVYYKAIDQKFDCGCDHCAILRLDSLLPLIFTQQIYTSHERSCKTW